MKKRIRGLLAYANCYVQASENVFFFPSSFRFVKRIKIEISQRTTSEVFLCSYGFTFILSVRRFSRYRGSIDTVPIQLLVYFSFAFQPIIWKGHSNQRKYSTLRVRCAVFSFCRIVALRRCLVIPIS